jgi:YesN/AraC family two-component response regulator
MSSAILNYGNLPSADNCEIKSVIRIVLEREEVITNPRIRLSLFAEMMDLSPKVVSHVIKKEFKKGFNELLNKYRIRFAIEKIEEGYLDLYTLEALGEESGFSSRTTFFNAFKKELGISPSAYWKRYQELPD